MKQAKILSIIIVDYKATRLVRQLLVDLESPAYEVIVVDNNEVNRGYGGGANYGASLSGGKYLLFMNPDVEIRPGEVQKLLLYLQKHPDVGAVGPQFLDGKGNLVLSSLGELTPWGAFFGLSFLHRLFPQNQTSQKFWLANWDRKTTREVAAINGACFMVRRKDFETIGGFDESFFLYWEENDLCDRLRALGKRIIYLSEARATHLREVSMNQSSKKMSSIFSHSRQLYLHKRFGTIKGELINTWIRLTEEWRAILLLGLALFVRLRDLNNISLIDDVRRDYGQAISMLSGKGVVLLGIPSSVPRFSQGPLNIWFDALAFKLGGVSPYSPVILAGFTTSLGIMLFYLLLKHHVHKNAAFLAALMVVFSPAGITQSRMPFYLFAIPVSVVFFLQAIGSLHKQSTWFVFVSVLAFCFLFQWELATIPFAAVLLVAMYRNRIKLKKVWKEIVLAMSMGLSPQIISDATHQCRQLCVFFVWMGYRTLDVAGMDKRHGLNAFSAHFWQSVELQMERVIGFGPIGLVAVALVVGTGIYGCYRKKIKSTLFFYTMISSIFLLIGLIIHGDPSEAYFPPFITLVPIMLAFSIDQLFAR